MRRLIAAATFALLAACSPPPAKAPETPAAPVAPTPVATVAPAGDYVIDKTHASLLFRVDHLGFSHYTARFTKFDAKLGFNPTDPSKMTLEATVDPRSIALENPPPGFENELRGPNFLDTAKYPQITYRSTAVELTGPDTARVTGDFTLHGVTKPLTLDVKFNGGYAGHPMDPHARIGFSAKGTLNRSDYGISYGVPAPGTTMGVSDAVEIIIETEMSGPALAAEPTPAPAK